MNSKIVTSLTLVMALILGGMLLDLHEVLGPPN